jgi:hypothetical protein
MTINRARNEDAYGMLVSLIIIIPCVIFVIIMAGVAMYNGVDLAMNIDAAPMQEVTIADTFITTSPDGFLGTKTNYHIVTDGGNKYDLLTSGNLTAVNIWNTIENGDAIEIRTSSGYFVFGDYPKLIPEGF